MIGAGTGEIFKLCSAACCTNTLFIFLNVHTDGRKETFVTLVCFLCFVFRWTGSA